MDMPAHLNQAMRYIEEHLTQEIDFGELSRIACCSEHHFKRMFSFLAGMPPGEYIRRRRLSLAAQLLRESDEKIIDIALMLGYNSPDAFARAFLAMHGVSPSMARRGNVRLKSFPPLTFHFSIKGGEEMDYRIVEKPAFTIAGIKERVPLIYEGVNPHIARMFSNLNMEDIMALKQLSTIEPRGILCVSANFEAGRMQAEGEYLDQYIGVATDEQVPERWEALPVAAGLWAVFTVVGEFPRAVQEVWGRIYSEWFPCSGYESTLGPEILWNEGPDTSKPDFKSELWIPVIKAV